MSTTDQLEKLYGAEIKKLRIKLEEQNDLLQRIAMSPNPTSIVLKVLEKHVVLVSSNDMLLVNIPDFKVNPGDCVMLSHKTNQILGVLPEMGVGEVATVTRIYPEGQIEVDYHGEPRIVAGTLKDVKRGDLVMMDSSGNVAVHLLPRPVEMAAPEHVQEVGWDDIGGCEEAKEQLIEAVEFPVRYKKLYAHYHKKPVKGMLLYGPPGCGKTLIARAVVTSVRQEHKATPGAFLYIKGPEILSNYVSIAEERIRTLFTQAQQHKRLHGYPAVIFIDEADAILGKRGSGISSDMEKTIVPAFLAEMDGLEDSGAVVLLATNRADVLDPAVVREGRIDRKVYVGRPDRKAAEAILSIHLRGIPLRDPKETFITFVVDFLHSKECRLFTLITKEREELHFTLGHVVSGSMLAGIIDQASSIALRRDITDKKATGVTMEDAQQAITKFVPTYRTLDHHDDLVEFTRGRNITEIIPCDSR